MIRRNEYGLSPRFEIAIDHAEVDYQALNEIELHLAENQHDMLILHMAGLPTRASAAYRTKGVRLRIDTGASYVQEFAGYVIDVRPDSVTSRGLLNGSPFQDVKIICLGASYDMRGTKSAIWDKQTLAEIASEIAIRYNYSLDVPEQTLIKSPIVQTDESDWQFLVRLAKEHGLSVTLHGTHIHIFDPHLAVKRGISFNRLFTAKTLAAQPMPGQITRFKASLAERHPDGVYKDAIVTVQQDNGVSFDVTSGELRHLDTPAKFQDRISSHALNYSEAVRTLEMHSKKMYDFYAKVEVSGVAGCKPGGVVEIEKYDSEVDGLWYVQEVRHSLTSGVFTSELCLAKNISSELSQVPVRVFGTPPAHQLIDDKWRASRAIRTVY